jgi:hypothetical protein
MGYFGGVVGGGGGAPPPPPPTTPPKPLYPELTLLIGNTWIQGFSRLTAGIYTRKSG